MPQRMPKAEFLKLSKDLCEDCRRWLVEVEAHQVLTAEELAVLTEAVEIIDRATVKLTVE